MSMSTGIVSESKIVHVSLTILGSINVDEFWVIRVGSLITFVKLNNDKQLRSCRFVNGKTSRLMSPTSMT